MTLEEYKDYLARLAEQRVVLIRKVVQPAKQTISTTKLIRKRFTKTKKP